MQKNALVKLDRKRYWVNGEKSYGYGHPGIESNEKIEKNIAQSGKKRKIDPSEEPEDLDLTFRKKKKVQHMFK